MRKDKIRILHIAQAAGGVDRYIRMLLKYSFNEKVETIRKAKAEMNRQRDCLNNLDVEHLPFIMWRLSFLTMKKHEISM